MQIRQAELSDIDVLITLDHSYATDHVWQMSGRDGSNEFTAAFRLASLPRHIQVQYPHNSPALRRVLHRCDQVWLMLADNLHDVLGYIGMVSLPWQNTGWVPCLCVVPGARRKGIGTQLVRAATAQAKADGLQSLTIDLQTKNYPGTRFCQGRGFHFCGYADNYYSARDIALFFTYRIR